MKTLQIILCIERRAHSTKEALYQGGDGQSSYGEESV